MYIVVLMLDFRLSVEAYLELLFSDRIHQLHLRIRQVRLSTARQARSTVRKGTTVRRVPVTRRVLRLSARNLQVRSFISFLQDAFPLSIIKTRLSACLSTLLKRVQEMYSFGLEGEKLI
jgi:hypothetical protein